MTETEWLACEDVRDLLRYLRYAPWRRLEASARKYRLIACVCLRALVDLDNEEQGRNAADVAERFADGPATRE